MLEMLKPPEWGDWTLGQRAAYAVGLVFVLGLMTYGASALYERVMAGL